MDPVVWMMYVYCFRDHTVYKRVEVVYATMMNTSPQDTLGMMGR